MSNFGDFRNNRAAAYATAFTAFFFGILAIFFAGWILFLTYNAFAPDSLPYMGLWTAFGISYIFRYVCLTFGTSVKGAV